MINVSSRTSQAVQISEQVVYFGFTQHLPYVEGIRDRVRASWKSHPRVRRNNICRTNRRTEREVIEVSSTPTIFLPSRVTTVMVA